jgi:hypothetical protein
MSAAPKFVEIIDPLASLTDADRADLLPFLLVLPPEQRTPRLTLRSAIVACRGQLGEQSTRRGYRAWLKVRSSLPADLPVPPPPAAWRVWRLVERERWKYAAVTADDSPARASLSGRNVETRHQQALAAVKAVRAFRAACEAAGRAWWFKAAERVMLDV